MDELTAIVAELEESFAASKPSAVAVMATVVDVEGSSYRRPGARMLILPSGRLDAEDGNDDGLRRIGMISGGCLERELCQAAAHLTHAGPKLVSFDTRENRLQPAGRFGSGCSGLIHILLEPIADAEHPYFTAMREVVHTREPRSVGVVCSGEGETPTIGTRFTSAGPACCATCASRAENRFAAAIAAAASGCEASERPTMVRFVDGDAWCEVFFQRVDPAPSLWIFGAGDDAIPLARMAEVAGMHVTVFDKRAELVTAERFGPTVERQVAHPSEVVKRFAPAAATNIVLMTHSLNDDALLLPWAVRSPASYVGLLGPKRRTGRVLQAAHERGATIRPNDCEHLRTPAGLDLGAANAAEIAVSILAEIIAARNARDGRPLLHRTKPIHVPAAHDVVELAPVIERASAAAFARPS